MLIHLSAPLSHFLKKIGGEGEEKEGKKQHQKKWQKQTDKIVE